MNESTTTSRRSPIIAFGVAAVLVAVVTAGVLVFLGRSASAEFDPVSGAALFPDDTHFYIAFNTDFTSNPWAAMPQLLNALDIEDNVRADLQESAEEEDLDFEEDIVTALASMRSAGVAVQYNGTEDAEFVFVIDSRDRDRVIALFADSEEADHRTERDDDLGLDFDVYVTTQLGPDDVVAVTVDDGIIYMSDQTESISSFIARKRERGPLSESQPFLDALEEVGTDALTVMYGSGAIFDHRDFRDVVDAFTDSAEFDPREASLAFSLTANTDGFGARLVVNVGAGGSGAFEQLVTEPADIDGLAALTHENALFFAAGSGLHDALEEGYASIEQQERELLDLWVYPFEDATGLSLEHDLIPLIGSTYGFAISVDDVGGEFDPESVWVLGLIESGDPTLLREHLESIIDELEFECLCDTSVRVSDRAGYTAVEWPEVVPADPPLLESSAFQQTRALLPNDPAFLYFLNVPALPQSVFDAAADEIAADPDSYDFDLQAVLGFAIAGSGDDTSFTVEMVMPVDVGAE
jgi:hypothetical protein